MPASWVRLSAGRQEMSDELQALCFLAGANSMFYGDRLLTTDNPDADRDDRLFLTDDPVVEPLFHLDQLLDLSLHQLRDRDAGPLADHLGDVLLGYLLGQQ